MGRFRSASADEDMETAIDMSPLIDCVFILLIFFIVTTVFVEETGVEVDKPPPSGGTAEDLEKTSILIAITEEGDVVYGKQNIGTKGVDRIVRREFSANPEIPVIIQGDKGSNFGIFAEVFQQVKAVDPGIKVSFATQQVR